MCACVSPPIVRAAIGTPVYVVAAIASDQYRKPARGMWDFALKEFFSCTHPRNGV